MVQEGEALEKFNQRMALIGRKPEKDGSWNLDYTLEINPRYADIEKAYEAVEKLQTKELAVARDFLLMEGSSDEEVRGKVEELLGVFAERIKDPGLVGCSMTWGNVGASQQGSSLDDQEFVAVALLDYLKVLEAGGADVKVASWDTDAQEAFRHRLKFLGIDLELVEAEDDEFIDSEEDSASLSLSADRDDFKPDETRRAIKALDSEQCELARRFLERPEDTDEQIKRRLGRMFVPLQRKLESYKPQYQHDYSLEVYFPGFGGQDHHDQLLVIALLLDHLGVLEPAGIGAHLEITRVNEVRAAGQSGDGELFVLPAKQKSPEAEEIDRQLRELGIPVEGDPPDDTPDRPTDDDEDDLLRAARTPGIEIAGAEDDK